MRKINLSFGSLIIAAISFLFTGCDFTSREYPGFDKSESGVYYKFHNSNRGDKATIGDFVTLVMIYRTEDSTIFDSRANPTPMKISLNSSDYKGDIYEAIGMMAEGDSASFIMSADSFFLKTSRQTRLPDFIKSNSILFFDIKLVEIQSKADYQKEIDKEKKEREAKDHEIENHELSLPHKHYNIDSLMEVNDVDRIVLEYREKGEKDLLDIQLQIPNNVPRIVYDVCPGECCYWGRMYALCKIPVYRDDDKNSKIAFKIKKGEKYTEITGNIHTIPGVAKINETFSYSDITFKKGDTIYILYHRGEGNYEIWYDSKNIDMSIFDYGLDVIAKPVITYWVKIKTQKDKFGWILEDNTKSEGYIPG